jgi:hypothetical protein
MANTWSAENGKLGGRPPGSQDKISRTVKERIIAVWDNLDAKGLSLEAEAEKDPQWFYGNFIKSLVPKEVDAKIQGEVGVRLITNVVAACTKSNTSADQ